MIYKLYITINLLNNKKYIGASGIDGIQFDKYYGSNRDLKNDIKKYGDKNFYKIVLKEDNIVKIAKLEEELINKLDAINSEDYYNKGGGGIGCLSAEATQKKSLRRNILIKQKEGLSQRQLAAYFNLSRWSIRKILMDDSND